jgi:arylsulfatase A-like enzyme
MSLSNSKVSRMSNLRTNSIFYNSLAGFLGGAFAGFTEALIRSINYSYYNIDFFAAAMFYYSLLGIAVAFAYAIIVLTGYRLMGLKGKIRALEAIIFSAAAAYLLLPIIRKLITLTILNKTGEMIADIIETIVLLSILYLAIMAVFVIFKKLTSLAHIKWWKAGLGLYVIILIPAILLSATGKKRDRLFESALAGFAPARPGQEETVSNRPNVIFIIIDALRRDRLSCYGYDIETPHIQSLADDGILYTAALSNCSWTRPSIASMITSLNPLQHNVRTGLQSLNRDLTTIAKVMSSNGYFTIGLVNNPHINSTMNFDIGFDYYEYFEPLKLYPYPAEAPGLKYKDLINRIARRLASKKKMVYYDYQEASTTSKYLIELISRARDNNCFLFVHYMDPHAPYFTEPYTGHYMNPKVDYTRENLATVKGAYEAEIKRVDRAIGLLIGYLKNSGQYDNTMIIFTADHGEEFLDHGGWGHGKSLFDEQLRIPLIIKLPHNEKAGTIDSTLVESIDIAPSIAGYLNIDIPGSWTGINIFSDSSGSPHGSPHGSPFGSPFGSVQDVQDTRNQQTRWSLAESKGSGNQLLSLRSTDEKIYLRYREGVLAEKHYYNLKDDPKELNNLAYDSEYQQRVWDLISSLKELENRYTRAAYVPEEIKLDEETKERLKALGYLQ